MLFNSVPFAVFLPIVFLLYWKVFNRSLRLQNLFLLAASYFFYAWWNWRFLSLIFISTVTDFFVGIFLEKAESQRLRKLLLCVSLFVNLGFLAVFKYYNFFIDSMVSLLGDFGLQGNPYSLRVVLPVGISFYTFQTLSYTIDLYRRRISATRDPISFFTFVSFFPQLVAGPIERASSLLPQFQKPRVFDHNTAVDGARQILWGMFKKVVVADTLAVQVDAIFANSDTSGGAVLLLGAVFFAFQIYGDFSGYSDIAIGTAKLFGFSLMTNFAYPYFSRDIAEFWRRWHISLSTWFRDYVYIPLGGSFTSKLARIRNIIITFTISGLWHGANWTFVVWGFLNGLYYLPLMLFDKQRTHKDTVAHGKLIPSFGDFARIAITFCLTTLTWVFFRADSVGQALRYLRNIFVGPYLFEPSAEVLFNVALITTTVTVEWVKREFNHPFQFADSFFNQNRFARWTLYLGTSVLILAFFGTNKAFIYFQF